MVVFFQYAEVLVCLSVFYVYAYMCLHVCECLVRCVHVCLQSDCACAAVCVSDGGHGCMCVVYSMLVYLRLECLSVIS